MDGRSAGLDCERDICCVKRYGGTPEEGRRIYLLLRRDKLAEDGRMRCVAATGDLAAAEQWRLSGTETDPRSWEAVPLLELPEITTIN